MKFSKQLVFDYLTGKKIKDYKMHDLRDNLEFMTEVVLNNKKYYSKCSKKVKTNFFFVKKIIENYSNDVDFCIKVSDYFLNNNHEEEKKFEINILMADITYGKSKKYSTYSKSSNFYYKITQSILNRIKIENTQSRRKKIGLGFVFYKSEYRNNEVILNYVSKQILNYLFFKVINLELSLHKIYNTYENIQEVGRYEILYNYIARFDKKLLDYVVEHPETLSNIMHELERIKLDWDTYEDALNNNRNFKIAIVIYEVDEYLRQNHCSLTLSKSISYVSSKLNIFDEIKEFVINNNTKIKMQEENDNIININDYKHLKEIKKIFLNNLQDFQKNESKKVMTKSFK